MSTLFFDETGPMIQYDGEVLRIHDLNPETLLRWRMSRREIAMMGWRCLLAALRPRR